MARRHNGWSGNFCRRRRSVSASTACELDGGRVRVPSAAWRVIIAVSHAYLHHRAALLATVPLRDLYDVFLHLGPGLSAADRGLIATSFERAGCDRRALGKALYVVERLFGPALPEGAAPGGQALWFWIRCLFRLRYPRTGQIVFRETAAIREMLSGSAEGRNLRKNLARPEWYIRHFKDLVDGGKYSPKS